MAGSDAGRAAGLGRRGLKWLGSAVTLSVLLAALSVVVALASYRGSSARHDRDAANSLAEQILDDAQAAVAAANEVIGSDYALFDSWYLHRGDPGAAASYEAGFSPALRAALDRSPDAPFDAAYYAEVQGGATELAAEAEAVFAEAGTFEDRAGRLELVVAVGAIGLACTAAAAMLRPRAGARPALAALALMALAAGAALFLTLPRLPGGA